MMSEFSVLHLAVVVFAFLAAAMVFRKIGRRTTAKGSGGGSGKEDLS
jgi:hypothetical protein